MAKEGWIAPWTQAAMQPITINGVSGLFILKTRPIDGSGSVSSFKTIGFESSSEFHHDLLGLGFLWQGKLRILRMLFIVVNLVKFIYALTHSWTKSKMFEGVPNL